MQRVFMSCSINWLKDMSEVNRYQSNRTTLRTLLLKIGSSRRLDRIQWLHQKQHPLIYMGKKLYEMRTNTFDPIHQPFEQKKRHRFYPRVKTSSQKISNILRESRIRREKGKRY